MVMERISNNQFRRKGLPERTQYLKDCDDDTAGNFRWIKTILKVLLGLSTSLVLLFMGYFIDLIFIH